MPDILAEIVETKRQFVEARKQQSSLVELQAKLKDLPSSNGFEPNRFEAALRQRIHNKDRALITEIKKASPSKGLIRADFDPVHLAKAYANAGATALSVLTDEPYFQGRDADLIAARTAVNLPILRKDFMIDPYQIYESRLMDADCILLIMAALSDAQAQELEQLAHELGLSVLIEIHDEHEFERALRLNSALIGVNNRNLKTLEVRLETAEALLQNIPESKIGIAESGLYSDADLVRMEQAGAKAFLIGESLMRHADVEAATRALLFPS